MMHFNIFILYTSFFREVPKWIAFIFMRVGLERIEFSATFPSPFSFLCSPFAKENLVLDDHFPVEYIMEKDCLVW